MRLIEPQWTIDARVRAVSTTRHGGVSTGPFARLNLGLKSGDDPEAVAENRRRLAGRLPAAPCWLGQVHGTDLIDLDAWTADKHADAAWTARPGKVVAIQTADCLPLLIAHGEGELVAGVHAGWRGLAAGIIEKTLEALPTRADELHAWIGPGICRDCYQVGAEVRSAFVDADPSDARAFEPDGKRWRVDLKAIAADRLSRAGVAVTDAGRCTCCEPGQFYSFRRDGTTGRMASLIWLEK